MKIEIELKDFWLDDESDLEPALKRYVINEAVKKIESSIKGRVEKHIDTEVKRQVEEKMYSLINGYILETIAKEKIKDRYNSKEITLLEGIQQRFANSSYVTELDKVIKDVATKYGQEMKQRYDLLFASQLVAKMSDNQMLKEDVAKLLLPTS